MQSLNFPTLSIGFGNRVTSSPMRLRNPGFSFQIAPLMFAYVFHRKHDFKAHVDLQKTIGFLKVSFVYDSYGS